MEEVLLWIDYRQSLFYEVAFKFKFQVSAFVACDNVAPFSTLTIFYRLGQLFMLYSLPTGKQVAVEENDTLRQIRAILRGNIEEIVARKVADDVEDAAEDTKRPTEDDSKQGDRVEAKK